MSAKTDDASPVEIRAPKGARLLEVVWSDGSTSLYEHLVLRAFCPCAHCQGHQGPVQWLDGAEELLPPSLDDRDERDDDGGPGGDAEEPCARPLRVEPQRLEGRLGGAAEGLLRRPSRRAGRVHRGG